MILKNKTIFITGVAGFIGANLAKRLLKDYNDIFVIGLDNLNDYYNVNLKEYRLKKIEAYDNFKFIKGDLNDKKILKGIFNDYKPDIVVNLAAQAGVRYSITNPDVYIESNLLGFYNILESCKNYNVKHFVFASSSSIYGNNLKVPFSIDDKTDEPVSLYAATKKANELLAHSYSKLYDIPTTGLRFFTVYGPAGRPDMAYFDFTKKILAGEKIKIFNYGNCKRDFTYIDDIIEGLIRVIKNVPKKSSLDNGMYSVPYKIYNIGKGHPEKILDLVEILQNELKKEKLLPTEYDFQKYIEYLPMQPGDVETTYADTSHLEKDFNYKPKTTLEEGLSKFVKWYKEYYIKK